MDRIRPIDSRESATKTILNSLSSKQPLHNIGSAVQLSADECEAEHAEFIQDPLRLPMKEDAATKGLDKQTDAALNENWYSLAVTFGRIPRDEMALVHVVQE